MNWSRLRDLLDNPIFIKHVRSRLRKQPLAASGVVGLAIIGVQSSFILGIQAGLLTFIPTVGPLLAGVIVVLASIASGWIAAASAFVLFLGVHALESYILTPILQRQALDIPPATLFAFQILLGVVFGIWGLALALPVMAIAKVMVDYFKADETSPDAMTG